jgi:hypothetical protein
MWLVKLNNNDCILCPASFKKKNQSSIINYFPIVHVHTSVLFEIMYHHIPILFLQKLVDGTA